ncbi:MAG: radical SAM protein [Dehalococcoidales bacterium]|nr:radical SAM protein [Dehalococcoidales bacterium]
MPQNSPRLIDWAITPKCNLSCRHCRGMSQGELSTARAQSLIGEIAKLRPGWVIVEGGEPLLREDLFGLLDLMQQKHLDAHLITNGMLLTPRILTILKSLGAKVMISIDGATAATYEAIRCGASFEEVVEQAYNCAREGLLEALNFTVMKTNYTEIPGVFEIAKSIGVKQITVIGFKPCHGYHDELLSPKEYLEAIRLACEAARRTGVGLFFDEPFFWAIVKEKGFTAEIPVSNAGILASSTTACIFGEYLFIEPNGDVKPCSFAPMVLGNVNEKCLDMIWREVLVSPFFQQIKEPKTRTGQCRDCRYVVDCKGCRSRTFMLTGDWFASDSCCPLVLGPISKKSGG